MSNHVNMHYLFVNFHSWFKFIIFSILILDKYKNLEKKKIPLIDRIRMFQRGEHVAQRANYSIQRAGY